VDEKSSEIIDEIETSRHKLGENLHDLESRAATVWKGYISFGMVSIPIRLYSGARGYGTADGQDADRNAGR
jgi:hypothetical protein